MKVARELKRNSVGFEIKKSLIPVIKKKLGVDSGQKPMFSDEKDIFQVVYRDRNQNDN
jgi:site-specific DNA-methyltransferase (adenine-specific)